MPLTTLFFDAGNTLIFPNLERTLAPLTARGLHPTTEQLHASERAAKQKLDETNTEGKTANGTDFEYWHEYYSQLLRQLNFSDPAICAALVRESRISANWNRLAPRTLEVLERLSKRFRLGIISNADGHIAEVLESVGIARCFESVTDSGIVGQEKPHPAIFQAAIRSLGIAPVESVYVGDIYSVDYLGAKAAGMEVILMDVSGTYRGRDLPRVESLAEIEMKFAKDVTSAI